MSAEPARVIALTPRPASGRAPIRHRAGIVVPDDPALIGPALRAALVAGSFGAAQAAALAATLRPRDRVLELGSGLGVVTTLIAGHPGLARLIAVEPHPGLHRLAHRVRAANPTALVPELVAGLPGPRPGTAPFYLRADPARASAQAQDGLWTRVIDSPCLDLDLILTEERITLLVADIPSGLLPLLARARLDRVTRLVLTHPGDPGPLIQLLGHRGFRVGAAPAPVHVFARPG